VKDPTYSRDPLEKFAKYKTDDEATRVKRLAKFITEERAKGHHWKRALYRYKGTYQVAPSQKILSVALTMARGT